jgi:uncharacterized membrane protein YfcA
MPGWPVPAWLDAAGMALAAGGLGAGAAAWLAGGVALAGFVRGFTGFGTALVMLPLAAIVIRPAAALALLVLLEIAGIVVLARRAWAEAERRAVGIMALGMLAGIVPGVAILLALPVEGFRWAVGLVALASVAALAAGWRWPALRGPGAQVAVGAVSGFLGGATGLSGPPVVLWHLASPLPAAVVRANLILYLLAVDVALLAGLALGGALAAGHLVAAALLAPLFMAANGAGAALFRRWPGAPAAYRPAALALMAGAAVAGLPVWG